MKNKILLLLIILFSKTSLFAEDLVIEAQSISIDKEKQNTIFEKNCVSSKPSFL